MAVAKRNASHRLADDPQEIRRSRNFNKQWIVQTPMRRKSPISGERTIVKP
jgi:hypothetical protein